MPMFGGKNAPPAQQTTSESTYKLGPEQQQIFDTIFPTIKRTAQQGINLPKQTYIPPNALQTQAQEGILAKARTGDIKNLSNDVVGANRFLLNDAIKVDSNPHLAGYVDASRRSLDDAFRETVLPGIGQSALASGGYGDTRHGVSEGIATGKYMNAARDLTSQIYNNAYNSGLDAMSKGIALSPTGMEMASAPERAIDTVGALRRQEDIAKMGDQFTRGNMDYILAQDMLSMLQGIPGGTNVATTTGPPTTQPGGFQKLMGGASAGMGMAGTLTSAGMAVNPLLGLGLGALAGVLM